jgi:hypothetical protein
MNFAGLQELSWGSAALGLQNVRFQSEEPLGASMQWSRPIWERAVLLDLSRLMRLEPNWDTYGGKPLSPDIASYAFQLLRGLFGTLGHQAPMPSIAPLAHGGVQLVWEQQGRYLEIEIRAPYKVGLLYEEPGSAPIEREIGANHALIRELVSRFG